MRNPTKILVLAIAMLAAPLTADAAKGKYADVNGLKLYYEVHGKGRPLVLIHGAFCTIDGCFGKLVKQLAKSRQVIVMELQGHGRTADVDRPLATPTMADDVAALLAHLKITNADIYGYSMGGAVATRLALRHPTLVRKLVVVGASLMKDGAQPGANDMIKAMKPEMMEGSMFHDAYKKTSPHPEKFRTLVKKIQGLDTFDGFKQDELKKITVPVLFLIGDADYATVEHGAQMLRVWGGGAFGDTGQPRAKSQLSILPGTSHIDLINRPEWITQQVTAFLDAK